MQASLKKLGVPLTNPLVLRDEAESGTKCNRDLFVELMTLVRSGQVRLIAVDDQARFSRADHAFTLINDVVFHGGRFISTGEGIDTNQEGWELRVKVNETFQFAGHRYAHVGHRTVQPSHGFSVLDMQLLKFCASPLCITTIE
ncbi:MAG: hypothetical protein DHS20C16_12410 [Phycisphaerae bacterium]|nr:MAG: hypothetical protein DHS20C16_12410 [Phycisphaerae bacterium]